VAVGRDGEAVAPLLKSLVPDRISIFLPEQQLDPVGGLVAEDEDVARERIAAEPVPHEGGESVERFAEIRRSGRKPDADGRWQAQHDRPPCSSSSTTRTRVPGSNPAPTRTERPLARTTSMPTGDGSVDSARTCTGRKEGWGWSRRPSCLRHQ